MDAKFEKLFIHKGEDSDDPPEKWTWTIRGGFPIEVWTWIEKKQLRPSLKPWRRRWSGVPKPLIHRQTQPARWLWT